MNRHAEDSSPRQLDELVERARRAIPALTFAATLLLMIGQTYVPVFESLGRARWLPVLVICGIGGASIAATRRLPREPQWFDACVAAFLVLAFLSSTYAINARLAVGRTVSVAVVYFAIFWTIWPLEVSRNGYRRTLIAIAAAAAVVIVLSYVIIPFIPAGAFVSYWRFQGIMESPNSLGMLVALTLPLVLWAAVSAGQARLQPGLVVASGFSRTFWPGLFVGSGFSRSFWRVIVGLMIVGAQLSQSRTTALAALIGAGYYLYQALPDRRRRLGLWAACYLGLTAVIPQTTWAYQEFLGRRQARLERQRMLRESQGELQAAARRIKEAQIALEHMKSQGGVSSTSQLTLTDRLERKVDEARYRYLELKDTIQGLTKPVPMPPPSMKELVDLATNPRNINLDTASGRTVAWKIGLQYLAERPLRGFGFGNEELLLPSRGFVEGQMLFFGFYFHNSYLGLALQVGLIGFVLFYLPLGALAAAEWRSPRDGADANVRTALRAVLLTGLVVACFESWVYSMGNALAFAFWTCVMVLASMRIGTAARSEMAAVVVSRES